MSHSRSFDVVVYGATGFTGQLVAEYLARNYGRSLRWAIAGRSREKLEAVRAGLVHIAADLADLPILLADGNDAAALRAMTSRTVALCTTAGPFARHGSALVAACVDTGTHYCDITGEVQWVGRMIALHHSRAEHSGVRIIHCSGFDSVPSDLGVFVLQERAREAFGVPASRVYCNVQISGGGVSGGTLASALNAMDEARTDRDTRRMLMNPYAIAPGMKKPSDGRGDQVGVRYEAALQSYTAPFAMALVNSRIVYRSNALMGLLYGESFDYLESLATGKGPAGALKAAAVSAATVGFQAAAAMPQVRTLLNRVLPASGEGPSLEKRKRARFRLLFLGIAGNQRVRATFSGNGDPGYDQTAKMLGETVVSLACDQARLPRRAGVLTAASGLGSVLVERLRARGMGIETSLDA